MTRKSGLRKKRVHFAALVRADGSVSAACYVKPRPINIKLSSWTNRRQAVTCPECKRAMANGAVVQP